MKTEDLIEKNKKLREGFNRSVSHLRAHALSVDVNCCDTKTFVDLIRTFFKMEKLPLLECREFPTQQKIDDKVVLGKVTARFFFNDTSPTPQVFCEVKEI